MTNNNADDDNDNKSSNSRSCLLGTTGSRPCAKGFPCFTSANPYNLPEVKATFNTHFTDEQTETEKSSELPKASQLGNSTTTVQSKV